ncbi:hypothetical protein V6N13_054343 [Hibiscus sabdariffa]|uniref:Uncharacterized protein n=1 Tax=Hibiscus sabdariffa TaxID=183260 RepID=A0ABR2DY45_9ROSI
MNPNRDLFPFGRFKWLMEFSMDHDWCAVVKELLGILFDGTVGLGEHSSTELALLDMCLLHRAVRRNCRPMVELLLRYVPNKSLEKPGSEQKPQADGNENGFMFKPNVFGPAGLTPLHLAASGKAVTTPTSTWFRERSTKDRDTSCWISPRTVLDYNSKSKLSDGTRSAKAGSMETEKIKPKARHEGCNACRRKLAYGNSSRTSLVYRPTMLSMVAIAALCVCVALLFKSSPEVLYVFRPFRWELLKYGSS